MGDSAPEVDELNYGFWVVAFVDLLGQKEAFLEADFLPDDDDEEGKAKLLQALKGSVGAIRRLHRTLDDAKPDPARHDDDAGHLRGLSREQMEFVQQANRNRVLELRWSDGVVLAASLTNLPGHNPVAAVWRIVFATATAAMFQVACGRPLRGGIDVGLGIELDGQLYGSSLVRAYELESERAKWPRVLVGDTLVDYLERIVRAPATTVIERSNQGLAQRLLGSLMCGAEDGLRMLDFAGQDMASLAPSVATSVMFREALAFARASRAVFRKKADEKLFGRYSSLVRYLEERENYW